MTQETQKQTTDKGCFCSFWGGENKDIVFSPADGSARGMFIGWKLDLFDIRATEHGIYSLSINLLNRYCDFLGGPPVYMVLP